MQEEFDDLCAVAVQVPLQIYDGAIPAAPDGLFIQEFSRQTFAAQNFGMHLGDQHFLIVGTVENPYPSALRQVARGAPKKIVLQLGGAGMLEAEYLTTLRIDSRHHVLYRTV